MITIRQVRAARALLDWSKAELCAAAGVSEASLADLEASDDLSPRSDEAAAIKSALETAGIVFIGREGVRIESAGSADEGRRPDELDATNDD